MHLNYVMIQVIYRSLRTLVIALPVLFVCGAAGFLLAPAWIKGVPLALTEIRFPKSAEKPVEPTVSHQQKIREPLPFAPGETESVIIHARDVCDRLGMLVRLEIPRPGLASSSAGLSGEDGWERVLRTSGALPGELAVTELSERLSDSEAWMFIGPESEKPAVAGRNKRPEPYRVLSTSREQNHLSNASSKSLFSDYRLEPSPFFSNWPRPVLGGVKENFR